jgi:hypothetical protein
MADGAGLILQVLPVADSDAEELADLAAELHAELLSVDGTSVAPLPAEAAPEGAKGLGDVAGWRPSSGRSTGCAPWWPPSAGSPPGRAGPWTSPSAGIT